MGMVVGTPSARMVGTGGGDPKRRDGGGMTQHKDGVGYTEHKESREGTLSSGTLSAVTGKTRSSLKCEETTESLGAATEPVG